MSDQLPCLQRELEFRRSFFAPPLQRGNLWRLVESVLHLHGTFADPPECIALTNDGYARLYPDGTLFRKFVWWLTTSKCLVFLGFGSLG